MTRFTPDPGPDAERPHEWQMWVDTGGTFTDCIAVGSSGTRRHVKVLSTSALRGWVEEQVTSTRLRVREKWSAPPDFVRGFRFELLGEIRQGSDAAEGLDAVAGPDDAGAAAAGWVAEGPDIPVGGIIIAGYDPSTRLLDLEQPLPGEVSRGAAFEVRSPEEAPILAARLLTATPPDRPLAGLSMRLATTRGTNALLERRGVATALFITRGFGDLLRIGTQQRPDLFTLDIRKPAPLYEAVVEVPERIAADGSVIEPFDLQPIARQVSQLLADGIRVAAVALMHSYRNPAHERALAELLLRSGFEHVSCSSDLAPFIKLLPRAETAVVDAYLGPVLGRYLERVQAGLSGGRLHVMTSAGGLVTGDSFHAKDGLLSGPAGGVVGAAVAGRLAGHSRVIAFDMGGTSTDVARFDGDYDYVFEHEVGDAHLVAPALAIETVAAGGGSICWFDGSRLRVGPESAGAHPGPACYGSGGPLCLTDVNLLLGRLDPERFEIPIDPSCAAKEIARLEKTVEQQTGEPVQSEAMLEGFLEIANQRMVDAIRTISLRRGYDPSNYALVAFGGAGPQHACGVAAQLGIETVLVPPDAGVLSALGIGSAVLERFAERQILRPLAEVAESVPGWIAELSAQATRAVVAEGVPAAYVAVRRSILNLRLLGQDATLSVDYDPKVPLRESFYGKHAAIYGFRPAGRRVEIESIRVVASSRATVETAPHGSPSSVEAVPEITVKARVRGTWEPIAAYDRARLLPGARFGGPALVLERHSATVVEEGWRAEVDQVGTMVLRRTAAAAGHRARGSGHGEEARPESVRLELFTNRFRVIAEEMGEMLRRTALSTNVKERLDFSCALLDADGELVVNAPHIPVHLGALGLCVRRLRDELEMEPGDVIVTNHPAFGGSHLPDVTVVTPVFAASGRLLGYVANRAHHAEIGGLSPGSMPPQATTLAEEGVVISPTYLVRRGELCLDEIRALLAGASYPSRAIEENLVDLSAAVAANRRGAVALAALADEHGEKTVLQYMSALKAHAEQALRAALSRIPDGIYEALEYLDDGAPLRVRIRVAGDQMLLDFAGSADVHPGNLNATPAIVDSVVIYVMRLLVDAPLPLNDGLRRAFTVNLPRGILNPDFPADPALAPAVVGGNVETSQRLVDLLLKALRLSACSQGTMNNVAFGTENFSYYETVCGGCGAGPDFAGASAVHSHMTNTRITDPEIIEHRYPVRVERFAIRKGSGGAGLHGGGDGIVREISFLERMSLSVLSQHRRVAPYGMEGGATGRPGAQRLIRAGGEVVELQPIDGCTVEPGDRFVLETPGGGGYKYPPLAAGNP
jgi:5-oxoprolinase (ATP-hydrolysing)